MDKLRKVLRKKPPGGDEKSKADRNKKEQKVTTSVTKSVRVVSASVKPPTAEDIKVRNYRATLQA